MKQIHDVTSCSSTCYEVDSFPSFSLLLLSLMKNNEKKHKNLLEVFPLIQLSRKYVHHYIFIITSLWHEV